MTILSEGSEHPIVQFAFGYCCQPRKEEAIFLPDVLLFLLFKLLQVRGKYPTGTSGALPSQFYSCKTLINIQQDDFQRLLTQA